MDAYEAAQDSMAQVALRFGVGQATVNRWVNCHRRTGRLEPLPHAGGSTAKVDEVGLSLLCLLLEEQAEATRPEVAQRYEQERGVRLSVATVGRELRRVGLTRKKDLPCHRTRPRGCHPGAASARHRVPFCRRCSRGISR